MVTDEELGKKMLVLNLIWLAILISLAVYLFVGLKFAPDVKTQIDAKTFGILRQVLYLLAIVIFVAPRFVKKWILSIKRDFGPPTEGQHPALQKYTVAMLVAWALSESIGIYGLVLYFLGKNTTDLYLLIGISAVALLMYRPSRDEVADLVRGYSETEKTLPPHSV